MKNLWTGGSDSDTGAYDKKAEKAIEYERKKKEDGKRARADKQHVLDMLFSAFEKHQYYNLKDLVDITKQPVDMTYISNRTE
ncbi:General transcription factor IIF subunit 2 [Tupaia chinensis]|uniref:General transcription factor IIF subunit 2 n=1 Tax=Tupaia chinensis TaxID=246437 RepID=L8YB54_TUPCH|nr:General transcription factor IIF subunit 2 [Tupaia chinensis]